MKTRICLAALAAMGAVSPVLAQQQALERVEVTGSSIKRIASQGALPVQTLTRADIDRSGAKSVEDLIQSLPSMQGFTTASESVNGSGGGVQTASIHSMGAGYTLVLLNGRRLAPFNSGAAVNLSSIPLSVVERVEVLTDGASALYGSDAVAGVVNFILRKDQTALALDFSHNQPQKSGGANTAFSVSKGFGELQKNGFNILASYAHEEQKELNAADRDFAKSGVLFFSHEGKPYRLAATAANTAPVSVTLNLSKPLVKPGGSFDNITFSPDYLKDGKCPQNTVLSTVKADQACPFDYAATVQLVPSSKRDSLFLSGNLQLDANTNLFMEAVSTRFQLKERHAPVAQALDLPLTDALYGQYVQPYLAKLGIAPADVVDATTNNRFVDAGGRSDLFKTQAQHLALGVEGTIRDIDYTASFIHSTNKLDTYYDGGYMRKSCYSKLLASGKFNPFAPPGGNTELLAPCVLSEINESTQTKLDVLSLRASGEVFKAGGGAAMLGSGLDYTRLNYDYDPSALAMGPNSLHSGTDVPFGRGNGALPAKALRKNWGAFTELVVPLHKRVEATAALRYDSYSKVHNDFVLDLDKKLTAPADQGNAYSKATYKLALRLRPIDAVMLRASYGTGFKAPSMTDITANITGGSNTSGQYDCPVQAPDPRAAYCKGLTNYDLLSGGNPLSGAAGLKPEESKNLTAGVRFEPSRDVSVGLDYWSVKMNNQISTLAESTVFRNPGAYSDLISVVYDAAVGKKVLKVLLPTSNIASSAYGGIDWDASYSTGTPYGRLALNWAGTYMLKSEYFNGQDLVQSIGRFDEGLNAVSRVVQHLSAHLNTGGMFSHTLAWHWRSGYADQVQTADAGLVSAINADGSLGAYATVARRVAAYSTLDWQTRAELSKSLSLTLGVKNLANQAPPLSIRNAGGGNQIGYDGRYASPLGRQFYLGGNFRY
ncbi:TonB-dependent receptor domain-containing protein [Roseateles aquae]|nr:TonB-dependent receptor [Paucibacter sp. APW11]